jgi:hypothetical protein
MTTDVNQAGVPGASRVLRRDQGRVSLTVPDLQAWSAPLLALLAIGFVLVGAGNFDLGGADARVGLAAGEAFGPLGRVHGYWAPDLWPGRVLPSMLARLFEEMGRPSPGSVLWPSALAAVAIGAILSNRLMEKLGARAGLLMAFAWFGSIGVIDHSSGTGLEMISGLATVAAIDRLISRHSDWTAGVLSALAFLAGGWPPVVLVLLVVIVLGRPGANYSPRLLLPPVLAALGWGIWAISAASAEAAAAALTLPFTQKPDWWLAAGVLFFGLPFAPLAFLGFSRSLRGNLGGSGRGMVVAWGQVAIACLIAGTIVPGLSQAARVPALAGMLVTSAAVLEAAWSMALGRTPRRLFLLFSMGLLAAWLAVVIYGSYLWLLVFSYYRPVGIAVLCLSVPAMITGWLALERSNTRRALVALGLLTVALKVVHWGYYVPEWNYRYGQGPWGRAIGQWLLPNWPLYTFHEWNPDLTYAIGRPVRKLRTPQHLAYPETDEARHVLLLQSEFEHWPESAPRLSKVMTFHDEAGNLRILARTDGVLRAPSGRRLPITAEP